MDVPPKSNGKPLDVVLVHGPTEDGEGARVLRARSGRVEAGEGVELLLNGEPGALRGYEHYR